MGLLCSTSLVELVATLRSSYFVLSAAVLVLVIVLVFVLVFVFESRKLRRRVTNTR